MCAHIHQECAFLRPFHSMETLEEALQEVENIPAYLPNCMQLKDFVLKAKDWLQEAEALQVKHLNLLFVTLNPFLYL